MRFFLTATGIIVALSSSAALAAHAEEFSWGKSGISVEQYRSDAISCGRLGYYMDVSNTEAAHVFKDATGQLTANEGPLASIAMIAGSSGSVGERQSAITQLTNVVVSSARIVEATRPKERMADVGKLMQSKVDSCLTERGYVRFRLTDEQRKRLGHLHLGSPERHAFLFGLATDPRVLAAQAY